MKRSKSVSIITLVLSLMVLFTCVFSTSALAEDPAPTPTPTPRPPEKTLDDSRKDGTYTIALNVTGNAEKKPTNVNVIVIVDVSGSMGSAATSQTTYTKSNNYNNNMYGTWEENPDVHSDDDFFELTRRGYNNNYVYTYASSGSTAYVPTNNNNGTQYGLVDGEYVQLTRRGGGTYFNPYYWTYGNQQTRYDGVRYTRQNNAAVYTGQRYTRDSSNQTRLAATKTAVNSLAENLLRYNKEEGNPEDTVQMALVSFSTTADTELGPTTDFDSFSGAVDSLDDGGGTNWEAALQQANNISFDDDDETFVIFFSDGSPTFHSSDGGYGNWNGRYSVYGSGQEEEPNMERSYNQAKDDAASLAHKVGENNFYTIFAYGTSVGAGYMSDLTEAAGAPSGNNYSAESTSKLQEAFDEILKKIEMSGIAEAAINDGTTAVVETVSSGTQNLLTVDPSSFKYYRAGGTNDDGTSPKYSTDGYGAEWLDAPKATYDKDTGAVDWDLSSLDVLENGVTYTVTYDCWPSQTTLDYIADIKNGLGDSVPTEVKQYLHEDGTLETNTTAILSYDDTRTEEKEKPYTYENPDPVATYAVEQLAVSKKWDNILDEQVGEPITLTVTRDGEDTYTMTLSTDNDWTSSVFVSIGIMRGSGDSVQVLEKGHDFTFTEPEDLGYYWELDVPTIRPMLINGQLKMLVLEDEKHSAPDGATEHTIDGKKYYEGDATATLQAINHRRARLNLTKLVDGEDANPEQTFPFTLNVVDSKASEGSAGDLNSDYYVWFSVYNGGYVDAVVSGAEKEFKDGAWTGYYYAQSGTDIVVNLKKDDNLRFLNLPTGSTYRFTEGTMPDNYSLTSIVIGEKSYEDTNIASGTITATNTEYQVTYTNTYALTDIEITKVWEDNDNQDGKRPTPEAFKSYLILKANGEDVTAANADKLTVTVVSAETTDGSADAGDNADATDAATSNKYLAKWTGLDRYKDGKEITYTVEEKEIPGYTTTGSPAEDHGTITNKHEPVKTTVKVTKVWEDEDNEYETRPESISVTLMAPGEDGELAPVGEAQTLSGDTWSYTWENLDAYKDGKAIEYSVDEVTVNNYATTVGKITGTPENGYEITITNSNVTIPTDTVAFFKKSVTKGTDSKEATFSFHVTGSTPMPEKDEGAVTYAAGETGDKAIDFGNITYTEAGEYQYVIAEVAPLPDGWSAIGSPATVTVTVTKDEETGELSAEVSGGTIINTYSATGKVSFPVKKVLSVPEGLVGPEEWKYTFNLTVPEGTPQPEGSVLSINVNQDEDIATFGPITYTAPGTYTYTVTESGTVSGVTNDSAEETGKTVTVTVVDNGDGTLTATASSTAASPLTFTNSYNVGKVAVSFPVEKEMVIPEGLTGPEEWSYDITVTANNGAPVATTMEGTVDQDNASVTFGEFEYTAAGTYTYTVSETGEIDGVTNDEDADGKTVTVTVVDNGDGTLTATASSTTDSPITFTNTYDATGNAILKVIKNVIDDQAKEGEDPWPDDQTLTFKLEGKDEGTPMPSPAKVELTKDSDPRTATFGAIQYTAADVGKTYTYTISEDGFTGSWSSSGPVTVTVTLTDNGEGVLEPTYTYDKDQTITNTHVRKTVDIRKVWIDDKNRDGLRPSPEDFKKYLVLKATVKGETTDVSKDNLSKLTVTETKVEEGDDYYTATWTDLDGYLDGSEITYTVEETAVEGYTTSGPTGTIGDEENPFTFFNTHKTFETKVSVKKFWDDNNNKWKKRGSAGATVQLYAQIQLEDGSQEVIKVEEPVTVGTDNNYWSYAWEHLPIYEAGNPRTYYVTETLSSDLYKKSGDDVLLPAVEPKDGETTTDTGTVTITNKYDEDSDLTYKFTFYKRWEGDQLDSIDWHLYDENGNIVKISFPMPDKSNNPWYYHKWFPDYVDYYVVEEVPAGYKVRYENVGTHADVTDRCYYGGTIVNYKVPKTGDEAKPVLWAGCVLAGLALLGGVVFTRKRRKNNG